MNRSEFPVIIVGAGPVGLALANELSYRKIEHLIVDEGVGDVVFPAGEAIFSRTMEHVRRWGFADAVRHHREFPDDYPLNIAFSTSINGRLLALFAGPTNATVPAASSAASPEGMAFCPKRIFDPMLREAAGRFEGSHIRSKTQLLNFEQTDEGVRARLKDLQTDSEYVVSASYLAACDGAKSAVRRQLNISYAGSFSQGHNFAIYMRAPKMCEVLARQYGMPIAQLHTVNTPRRPYLTTVNGKDLWRLSMYTEKAEMLDPEQAVRESIGSNVDFEVIRGQPWSGHRVVAERYRGGRTFLLGDAAHLRWPKGGFGANTGIGDAVDLGWKIAAVLEGWGGPELLDSYEAERRPIAIRNVNEASNNRELDKLIEPNPLLDEESPEGQRARDRASNLIYAYRMREFHTQGLQLGYRYRNSPICVQDNTLEPPDDHMIFHPSTWPGCRAPHGWVKPGQSTLDLFGRGFTLVRFNTSSNVDGLLKAAAERGVPLKLVDIDVPDIRQTYEVDLVLVRPDGHVAWRGSDAPQNPIQVIDRVRGAG